MAATSKVAATISLTGTGKTIMPTIVSTRPQTRAHDGKICDVVRSITEDDGEAFDVALAKSLVKLDDGSEVTVANIELQF